MKPTLCNCLRPIATEAEHAQAHAAGKCAVCFQVDQYTAVVGKKPTKDNVVNAIDGILDYLRECKPAEYAYWMGVINAQPVTVDLESVEEMAVMS
jgi:hypothetical protein